MTSSSHTLRSPLRNPRLVPRRVAARVLLVLLGLVPAAATVALFTEIFHASSDEVVGVAVGALVAAAFTGLFVFLFVREHTWRLEQGDNGVQLTSLGLTGHKTTTMLFAEIEQVFFHAVKNNSGGGLIGVLVVAAVDAATKPADGGINENTNTVTVTLKGAGKTLKFGNGNKGAVALFNDVEDAVSPRIAEAALRSARGGGRAVFGPLSMTTKSIFVNTTEVPFAEVKELSVADGTVRLKKEGAWFSKTVGVAQVPNLRAFLATFAALSGQG